MRITRPRAGQISLIPDASTGAGFEYRDVWEELITGKCLGNHTAVPTGETAIIPACMFTISIPTGSNLWEGYLPNTSLTLSLCCQDLRSSFRSRERAGYEGSDLQEGLVDVTVVPV